MKDEKLPITEHLEELRQRLIKALAAVFVLAIISYIFAEKILETILRPLVSSIPDGSSLVFVSLTEAFIAYIKISILSGLVVASPYVFYQLWMFVVPGLYSREKKASLQFVSMAVLALFLGILFCYFIILPVLFPFLLSFGKELIKPLPTIKSSVSVVIRLFLIFGLIFEIPVTSFYLAKIGLLRSEFFKGARKFYFLLSFILAAIITPPDIISQLIVGFPLFAIFEASMLLAKLGEKIHMKNTTGS
jgi:sec-independent protein translocase protein TatC